MANPSVAGIFGSLEAAQAAREALLQAGIAAERIVVTANLTSDGVAAEYPGQSFENQDYASSDADSARERYASEVRSAACIVNVQVPGGAGLERVSQILRRAGARRALRRPSV